jgi:non-ribosomal peptide synthetase component F
MTLLAAFKTLLYRYSGQEDICIGTPVAGRESGETDDLIGFFVNTLALRSNIKETYDLYGTSQRISGIPRWSLSSSNKSHLKWSWNPLDKKET